jgi:hypothetical protein
MNFSLFFYLSKLIIDFANVTSFNPKFINLFLTYSIPLNLILEIILSITHHIYLFIYYYYYYYFFSP